MNSINEVNPYGKFFSGDGVDVEMAIFVEKNSNGLQDVLLKFTGGPAFDAGIDNKVIKYQAVHAGTGVNFEFSVDGESRTRMLSRQSWGSWTFFEVFLNGKTLKVSFNEEKSKSVLPLHLLTASKQA